MSVEADRSLENIQAMLGRHKTAEKLGERHMRSRATNRYMGVEVTDGDRDTFVLMENGQYYELGPLDESMHREWNQITPEKAVAERLLWKRRHPRKS